MESLVAAAQKLDELPDGYALSYPASDAWATKLFEFVVAERQCCPFLTFELIFESNGGGIRLHLRGAAGVKELLQLQVQADKRS